MVAFRTYILGWIKQFVAMEPITGQQTINGNVKIEEL